MLFFKINDSLGETLEGTWHVGMPRPIVPEPPIGLGLLVQADGDELDYILTNFRGLPVRGSVSIVEWAGDLADFILRNL